MSMEGWQAAVTIAVVVAGTVATRFLPFLVFPESKQPPRFVRYLGRVLPMAMTGLLVVYALRQTSLASAPYGIPEAISLVLTVAVHWWKRSMLLSIAVGTLCHMVLVQFVFL